jgi:hypothetical protein
MSTKIKLSPHTQVKEKAKKKKESDTILKRKRDATDFYMELDIVSKQPLEMQLKLKNCIQINIENEVPRDDIIWTIETFLE